MQQIGEIVQRVFRSLVFSCAVPPAPTLKGVSRNAAQTEACPLPPLMSG
jgi:hypothetical protein